MLHNLATAKFFTHGFYGHGKGGALHFDGFDLIWFYQKDAPHIQWMQVAGVKSVHQHKNFYTHGLDTNNPDHWTRDSLVMHLLTHNLEDLKKLDIGYSVDVETVDLPTDFMESEQSERQSESNRLQDAAP